MSANECYGAPHVRSPSLAPLDAGVYLDLASAAAAGGNRLATFRLSPLHLYAHLERLVDHIRDQVPECTTRWILPPPPPPGQPAAAAAATVAVAVADDEEE
jgi:hypothetical protein